MIPSRLLKTLCVQKRRCVAVAASLFILAILAPLKSYILQWLLDASDKQEAIIYLLLGVAITLGSHFFETIARTGFARISCEGIRIIRNGLIEVFSYQSLADWSRTDSGGYVSLLTNDLTVVQNDVFQSLFDLVMWGAIGVVALVMLTVINPLIMLMAVAMSLVPLIVPKIMAKRLTSDRGVFSKSNAAYTGKVGEFTRNFETISLLGVQGYFLKKHDKEATHNARANYKLQKGMALSQVLTSFIIWLPQLLVLFVGVLLVSAGKISLTSLITAHQLTSFILVPMRTVTNSYTRIKSVQPICRKMEEELSRIVKTNGDKTIDSFQQVNLRVNAFTYPGATNPALKNISLTIHPGEKIAVVGRSGSGKSTLLKLLLRYYDVEDGEVLINGFDVARIDDSFSKVVAALPQKSSIFQDTMRNNITFGEDYTDEEIDRSVRMSGLSDVVTALPEGLDTVLYEDGRNLSGGEGQRLAIARALIRKCSLLLVDEATSNLDIENTQAIMESLLSLDCAVLVITHDVFGSYMQKFDSVCLLKDGEIRVRGRFDDIRREFGELQTQ